MELIKDIKDTYILLEDFHPYRNRKDDYDFHIKDDHKIEKDQNIKITKTAKIIKHINNIHPILIVFQIKNLLIYDLELNINHILFNNNNNNNTLFH